MQARNSTNPHHMLYERVNKIAPGARVFVIESPRGAAAHDGGPQDETTKNAEATPPVVVRFPPGTLGSVDKFVEVRIALDEVPKRRLNGRPYKRDADPYALFEVEQVVTDFLKRFHDPDPLARMRSAFELETEIERGAALNDGHIIRSAVVYLHSLTEDGSVKPGIFPDDPTPVLQIDLRFNRPYDDLLATLRVGDEAEPLLFFRLDQLGQTVHCEDPCAPKAVNAAIRAYGIANTWRLANIDHVSVQTAQAPIRLLGAGATGGDTEDEDEVASLKV